MMSLREDDNIVSSSFKCTKVNNSVLKVICSQQEACIVMKEHADR